MMKVVINTTVTMVIMMNMARLTHWKSSKNTLFPLLTSTSTSTSSNTSILLSKLSRKHHLRTHILANFQQNPRDQQLTGSRRTRPCSGQLPVPGKVHQICLRSRMHISGRVGLHSAPFLPLLVTFGIHLHSESLKKAKHYVFNTAKILPKQQKSSCKFTCNSYYMTSHPNGRV